MKFSSLVPSVLAAAGVAVASSAFSPAQAAVLEAGAGTCNTSQFTNSTECGGYFSGNHKASDIDAIFGGSWMEVVKLEGGTTETGMGVDLNVFDAQGQAGGISGIGATSGTWSASGLNYNLFDYVAVIKAGNSFSAYKLADGTFNGNWNTSGVEPVGSGNTPGLSNLALYKADAEPVPEPLTILGSATALGIGGLLKRQQSKKNNKA